MFPTTFKIHLLHWLWFILCRQLQHRRREAEQTERALWHWSLTLQAKVILATLSPLTLQKLAIELVKPILLLSVVTWCCLRCRCCTAGGYWWQSSAGNRSRQPERPRFTETSCWGRACPASSPMPLTWATSRLPWPNTARIRLVNLHVSAFLMLFQIFKLLFKATGYQISLWEQNKWMCL